MRIEQVGDFEHQIAYWGYEVWGEPDELAEMCETRLVTGRWAVWAVDHLHWWDRTAQSIGPEWIKDDHGLQKKPEYMALAGVMDWIERLQRLRGGGAVSGRSRTQVVHPNPAYL